MHLVLVYSEGGWNMEKTGEELFISQLAHVEEHRGPDEQVVRRRDYHRYLCGKGGGTFYRIDEHFSVESLFSADVGSRVTLVLRNLHTSNLDEVVFDVAERYCRGGFEIWCGYTSDTEDSYAVTIEYKAANPQGSYILVYASGRPLVF